MALRCNACGGVIPDIGNNPFLGCKNHIKPEINLGTLTRTAQAPQAPPE
jgi:hypothetical protein